MTEIAHSFCRICTNVCALTVEINGERVTKVTGATDNPLYGGYTCIKGRSQPAYLYHPKRLLHSLKRRTNGEFVEIPVETAMDEIAERLRDIQERFGPRAIASYEGCMYWASYSTYKPMLTALMDTLGSSMRFDPITIDKGGKQVAWSLHGAWMAPACGFDEPEVVLLIGINPIITFTGLPAGNPARWLKGQAARGMKLLVIDPRCSDVAKRADLHLRPKPGFDVDILACFLRTILSERLYDEAFVAANVSGVEELQRHVAPFDPETVAARSGLSVEDLVLAARTFAGRRRGYVMAGTGPHMSAHGTLVEYLVLALQSLCGYWLRAGDRVTAAPVLLPRRTYKAQARAPGEDWATGEPMGRLGLRRTAAGLPVTALPDEMLADGDRRVRALISAGGNPATAFPDRRKAVAALKSLDLFVQIDPWMSRSAELADYVIAPTMPLEAAAMTQAIDVITEWPGYGFGASYAQYTPAVAAPPAGSDLIDDWRFLHGVAKRLGFDGRLRTIEGEIMATPVDEDCTAEELLELMAAGSRVPFETVKNHSGGDFFPDPSLIVGPKDEGWKEKLQVANAEMMRDLDRQALNGPRADPTDEAFPFRLVCRRLRHFYNSSCNVSETNRGKPYNPAFLNPDDMKALALATGDPVTISSAHGAVRAVAEEDPDLPRGIVSIMFGYGPGEGGDDDARAVGTNPNELISCEAVHDPYTGQPRMSNIPVEVVGVPAG